MKIQNIFLLTSTILVCGMTSISHAQEKLENSGIVFKNGISLNKVIFNVIEYVGTCPGLENKNPVGRFQDKEVSTEKKRRVRITNEEFKDIGREIPYTDRKYKKNGRSQKIRFGFGASHRGSKFAVKLGVNKFNYLIYDGKYDKPNMQIIKRGSFLVEVKKNYQAYHRDIRWTDKRRFVCLNKKGKVMYAIRQEDLKKCEFGGGWQRVGNCGGFTRYGEVKLIRKKRFYN